MKKDSLLALESGESGGSESDDDEGGGGGGELKKKKKKKKSGMEKDATYTGFGFEHTFSVRLYLIHLLTHECSSLNHPLTHSFTHL